MPLSSSREPAVEPGSSPLLARQTPLAQLLHLLQGVADPSIADVGITRLAAGRLDAMSGSARREADTCLERAQLMLRLVEDALENDHAPDPALVLRVAQQVGRALSDYRRWRDLADNAAYYRDHPDVRERILSRL